MWIKRSFWRAGLPPAWAQTGLSPRQVSAAGQDSKIWFYILGGTIRTVTLLWSSFRGSPPSYPCPDLRGESYCSFVPGGLARLCLQPFSRLQCLNLPCEHSMMLGWKTIAAGGTINKPIYFISPAWCWGLSWIETSKFMQMTCKLDLSWISRKETEALGSAQGLWGCIVNVPVPCEVGEWSHHQNSMRILRSRVGLGLSHHLECPSEVGSSGRHGSLTGHAAILMKSLPPFTFLVKL